MSETPAPAPKSLDVRAAEVLNVAVAGFLFLVVIGGCLALAGLSLRDMALMLWFHTPWDWSPVGKLAAALAPAFYLTVGLLAYRRKEAFARGAAPTPYLLNHPIFKIVAHIVLPAVLIYCLVEAAPDLLELATRIWPNLQFY
jgi:hypothetical protein